MFKAIIEFIISWFSRKKENTELKETNFEQMNQIKEMEAQNEAEHVDSAAPGKYTL